MPLFMDVHILPGVKARDVAAAHQLDLLHQDSFGCKCMTYWIDEVRNSVFCLIEAPGKKEVEALHKTSHGLIPLKIIEVEPELVHSFLGRIFDPDDAPTVKGLKIFHDPSFRFLVVNEIVDPVLLQIEIGEKAAFKLLNDFDEQVNASLAIEEGKWVSKEHERNVFCFRSGSSAFNFSRTLLSLGSQVGFRVLKLKVAVTACEPVQESSALFGDGIKQGSLFCFASGDEHVLLSPILKLCVPANLVRECRTHYILTPSEESFLDLAISTIEAKALETGFSITELCEVVAMSQSQLYRKLIHISKRSPHALLMEFRLKKSKEVLKMGGKQVNEAAYISGFTSPSYFSKCFRERFGVLPADYARISQ